MDGIHGDVGVMLQGVAKSGDTQTSFEDYQNQLRNIADMITQTWHGRAKVAFLAKYEEIASQLKLHSADMGSISEGTNTSVNAYLAADDDGAGVLNALSGR